MKNKLLQSIYLALAFLFLFIGWIGVILPILPTTPFLLLATFFFAKGSTKFHTWFINTTIYKKHLDSFMKNRAMTMKTKICILIPASAMMVIALYFVPIVHAKYFIIFLIFFKYYYFTFRIKTIKPLEDKREKEKKVVETMIRVYCKGKKHACHGEETLCKECQELLDYANMRTDKCPFMETKTFCANCRVHCYKKDMRETIKEVMRYSGPRMLIHHPFLAISHVIESNREKKKLGEQG